jgi:glutamine amidotransferase
MLRKVGEYEVEITNDIDLLKDADKLILPGVGKFDYGMERLHESGLVDQLTDLVIDKKKTILGICLGAQLMTKRSDEGQLPGLGWVDGETVSFDRTLLNDSDKIPHMGWNYTETSKDVVLFQDMYTDPRFYFVHSYHLKMNNTEDEWLTTEYGYKFCSAYQHNNIYACQFHPEKSHKFGMKLMENFVAL